MSLSPLAGPLSGALGGRNVAFADDCIGADAEKVVAAAKAGDVVLLENLRFHAGEEKNDPAFAKQLAALADLYVNDAFSAAHRAHASTEGLAHLLPAAAGRLMQAELEALEKAHRPETEEALGLLDELQRELELGVLDLDALVDRHVREGTHLVGIAHLLHDEAVLEGAHCEHAPDAVRLQLLRALAFFYDGDTRVIDMEVDSAGDLGGGLYATMDGGTLTVRNTTFTDNSANNGGPNHSCSDNAGANNSCTNNSTTNNKNNSTQAITGEPHSPRTLAQTERY